MNKSKLILAGLAILSISFVSCKDDDDHDDGSHVSGPGTVTLDLTNVAGMVNVDETGATSYVNSSGESFRVNRLKYYISNIRLYKNDSLMYTMPESYFLVDESNNASTKLAIPDVPEGSYTKIKFMVGVDSTRNVSGAQTGALDPANGMFWTWASGYIFYKLEGKSPASTQPDSSFVYHIGGFKDGNNTNATRDVEVVFGGNSLIVDGDREAEIHVFADVLKVFSTPNTISIAALNTQMAQGGAALIIADNYANMFTFDHLHNTPH
jgi:hypothetical protein